MSAGDHKTSSGFWSALNHDALAKAKGVILSWSQLPAGIKGQLALHLNDAFRSRDQRAETDHRGTVKIT
jgi:hypothetical protein